MAKRSPLINHLLFADDTMFFSKTSVKSCEALLSILKRYEEASGQCINADKSGITFSSKTPPEIKDRVKKALGISKEEELVNILAFPSSLGEGRRTSLLPLWIRLDKELCLGQIVFCREPGNKSFLKRC